MALVLVAGKANAAPAAAPPLAGVELGWNVYQVLPVLRARYPGCSVESHQYDDFEGDDAMHVFMVSTGFCKRPGDNAFEHVRVYFNRVDLDTREGVIEVRMQRSYRGGYLPEQGGDARMSEVEAWMIANAGQPRDVMRTQRSVQPGEDVGGAAGGDVARRRWNRDTSPFPTYHRSRWLWAPYGRAGSPCTRSTCGEYSLIADMESAQPAEGDDYVLTVYLALREGDGIDELPRHPRRRSTTGQGRQAEPAFPFGSVKP